MTPQDVIFKLAELEGIKVKGWLLHPSETFPQRIFLRLVNDSEWRWLKLCMCEACCATRLADLNDDNPTEFWELAYSEPFVYMKAYPDVDKWVVNNYIAEHIKNAGK